MRKIFFATLAIMAAVSCSKTDVSFENTGEIEIMPVNNKVTKSVMAGTEFLGTEFNVWAWFNHTSAGADKIGTWQDGFAVGALNPTTVYINEKPFVERDATQKLWGGATPYYWPKAGSLIFAGYHAPNLTAEDAVTYTFDKDNNYMSFNDVQQVKLVDGETYNEDIMYFNMTPNSYDYKSGLVSLDFNHALTWITVTLAKKAHPEIKAKIRIHDVVFTNVHETGDGVVQNQETIVWTPDATSIKDFEILKDQAVELEYNKTTDENGDELIEAVVVTLDEYLIIPQSIGGVLKVRYSVTSMDGENGTEGSTFTETYEVNLTTLKDGHDTWLPGKHYTYNVSIGTDELLVTPVVNEWDDVDTSILIPIPEVTPGQPGTGN